MMATLPELFETKNLIGNMAVGQTGWIVPWAMWVDAAGNCWLNEKYQYFPSPGGTISLRIRKVQEGYIAYTSQMKDPYTWNKEENPGFAGTNISDCLGEVIRFK